ncbi:ParA family protein [Parablautia intestinalis]|uniref:ParA family protein n=1 Tax=Parablautia intestinalis TaxID=2320100 RepID=UPI00256F422B|nr:ParA family protein [Parablautia intestinalis]
MDRIGRKCKVIAAANQKGGVSKTTTTVNLGVGLARAGNRVLLIDSDSQASLTASMGSREPDRLDKTLAAVITSIMEGQEIEAEYGLLSHEEGVCFLLANIDLAAVEVSLISAMSREYMLKECIEAVAPYFDYIIVDCMPSLGMLTINALAAADTVLIPLQAQYLSLKGLEQLIATITRIKKRINLALVFEGILLTMVDARTIYSKEIIEMVRGNYGQRIPVFENYIPLSVRVAEASAEGKSVFAHDPKGRAALAYEALTKEVLAHGR